MSSRVYRKLHKVLVLGAGTMGSQIAAHIANTGIFCDLLDVRPAELTPDECANELTIESETVRNRIAQAALERMKRVKTHSPFYVADCARLIRIGNTDDNTRWIAEADWIIEAVIENLEAKREVHQLIDEHRTPGTLVSSNTSGISIREMSEGLSDDYKAHFLGTHFLNPPRYMHLLEVIPTDKTRRDVVEFICDFGEQVLAKCIVRCKDTSNFVANRIGVFALMQTIHFMVEEGYTIDEVDAITGLAMGRPRSATFRLGDIVGIDVLVATAHNLYYSAPHDEQRGVFYIPEFISQMLEPNWLGDKTGKGFYQKRLLNGRSEIWSLDYDTFAYTPQEALYRRSPDFPTPLPIETELFIPCSKSWG